MGVVPRAPTRRPRAEARHVYFNGHVTKIQKEAFILVPVFNNNRMAIFAAFGKGSKRYFLQKSDSETINIRQTKSRYDLEEHLA
jgi:hypothetical protein